MIELIYNEEGETAVGEKNLPEPKNVKKIGTPKDYKKIFIEDYVHTFLKRYSSEQNAITRVAVLLGESKRAGGERHLYIKSAYPAEQVTEKQGKFNFTEKVWGDVYQECGKYFPDQEILGWFLARRGVPVEKNAVIEETHRTYFSGADKILFMIEPLQQECGFFAFDGNRFEKQTGYYIYYEKNEPMREFLAEKNGERKKGQGMEKPDVAMANFRKILKEKQAVKLKRRKRALSYGMKVAIALVFFVGAVALKNQTDKIQRMEEQLSGRLEEELVQEALSEQVVIEELPGEVEAAAEVVFEETLQPEETEEIPKEELPVTESQEDLPVEETATESVTEPVEAAAAEVAESVEAAAEPVTEVPVYEQYQVQMGDTLAKICREKYGSDERLQEICTLNEIENGDYIQVGEIILLP